MKRSRVFALKLIGRIVTPAMAMAAVAAACGTEPTSVRPLVGDAAFAKPTSCEQINLAITIDAGVAINSDGGGDYLEGTDGVAAHTSAGNGNLMLSMQQSDTRTIAYTTSVSSGNSNDRLYTNTHTNPGGNNACGLNGMIVGSTGSAAVGFELWEGTREDRVFYGKFCNGSDDASTLVATTHADADTWTISGTSGRLCRADSRGRYQPAGTTGAFSMTLARQ